MNKILILLIGSLLMTGALASGYQAPQNLRLIFGETENKHYVPRVKAVHRLGRDLQPGDIAAIYAFFRKKIREDNLKPLELNGIKNELVIVIMKQRAFPNELTSNLINMYYDKSMDNVWRDYCVQFLGQWYPKISDKSEMEEVNKLFNNGLKEKKNGIAGTTLIAMSRLTEYPGLEREKVAQAAYSLAVDKDAPAIVKISALQVGANLKDQKIIPLAKEILNTTKSISLKMSAIAALGILGDTSSIGMLQKYRKSSDVRLRTAAKAALKKLEAK